MENGKPALRSSPRRRFHELFLSSFLIVPIYKQEYRTKLWYSKKLSYSPWDKVRGVPSGELFLGVPTTICRVLIPCSCHPAGRGCLIYTLATGNEQVRNIWIMDFFVREKKKKKLFPFPQSLPVIFF